jgi:hypothetical protein
MDAVAYDGRAVAIALTHAHFDHVRAIDGLLEMWDVPVDLHTEELPYVTGALSWVATCIWASAVSDSLAGGIACATRRRASPLSRTASAFASDARRSHPTRSSLTIMHLPNAIQGANVSYRAHA